MNYFGLHRAEDFVLRLIFILVFQGCSCVLFANEKNIEIDEPLGIFLTWTEDPTTTMSIDIHTLSTYQGDSHVTYRLLGHRKWQSSKSKSYPFPFLERTIHRTGLKNLKPGKTYEFTFGEGNNIYRFRTMPRNNKVPVRFITGGDTMHEKEYMDQSNKTALLYDPDFIVWGGDLAYANGNPNNTNRWIQWFESIKEFLIDSNNRVVPIIIAIGNHEVQNHTYDKHEGYEDTPEWKQKIAPFFYGLFAYPGFQGYNVLDFGKYLTLITLDSEQTTPIVGKQTQWLEEVLASRNKTTHLVPVYHVPGYPSNRPYDGVVNQSVRNNFIPLFEKYGVRFVFENHDHAYKRTYPLLEGKIVDKSKGIVYIGDGAWGTVTRPVKKQWYLAKGGNIRHFILVTLKGKNVELEMIDENGNKFDQYIIQK